jgi:hypothetical protein
MTAAGRRRGFRSFDERQLSTLTFSPERVPAKVRNPPKATIEAWLDRHQLRQESTLSPTRKRGFWMGQDRAAPTSIARGWCVLRGSGHLASFHRRKCKGPLNRPNATAEQRPEGWTLYQYPELGFAGIGDNSAEARYYTWVDQHNTLGLGNDVPISTGNENDALLALVDGKWELLRVPYRLSFCPKGLAGRIDDPNGGWGARRVDDERRPGAAAQGRRQGHRPHRLPFPIPPQPARRLTAPGPDLRRDAPAPLQEAFAGSRISEGLAIAPRLATWQEYRELGVKAGLAIHLDRATR